MHLHQDTTLFAAAQKTECAIVVSNVVVVRVIPDGGLRYCI